jgi:hypothetical protein
MINSFEKLVALGVWVNVVAFSGCTKAPLSEVSGSEAQYNTPTNKVLRYAGHASDCAVETIDGNSTTTFGEYRATLDRGWAQGVDIYLQNPQDPNSLVCHHPNRYISGQSKMVRPVVSIDGQTPQTPQGQSFANQAPAQATFRYVTSGNRNFIGYELTPGACNNSNQGGGNDCVIWGVVRANNRVSLVNGSCLGGYRISDIAPAASSLLVANGRDRYPSGQKPGMVQSRRIIQDRILVRILMARLVRTQDITARIMVARDIRRAVELAMLVEAKAIRRAAELAMLVGAKAIRRAQVLDMSRAVVKGIRRAELRDMALVTVARLTAREAVLDTALAMDRGSALAEAR